MRYQRHRNHKCLKYLLFFIFYWFIYFYVIYLFRINYPRQEIYSLQIWKPGFYTLHILVAQPRIEPQTYQADMLTTGPRLSLTYSS